MLFSCPVLGRMFFVHFHSSNNVPPSTGQQNNIAQPETDKWFVIFIVFDRLTVVSVLFCSLTKGITPKMCWAGLSCPNKKGSFEPFMCLDLVLER